MNKLPKRKSIRIKDYDYSSCGAYFITICTANREKIFWSKDMYDLCSPEKDPFSDILPENIPLSDVGMITEDEIRKLNAVYPAVCIEKYCIMPDHIHFIISINADENGQPVGANCVRPPTVSRVIKQFKGSITKRIGKSIWQKSFYDHGIRNQQDYCEIWQYIENNPFKYKLKRTL